VLSRFAQFLKIVADGMNRGEPEFGYDHPCGT
jgi:hypothetical protein